MKSRLRGILPTREGLIVAAFTAANVLLGLVANRMLTQYVSPDVLGELYLFLNIGMWLTLPTSAAYVYVFRHWPEARKSSRQRPFSKGMGLGLGLQSLVALAASLVLVLLKTPLMSGVSVALLLWIYCTGQATNQVLEPIQSLERRRVSAGILSVLGQPVRLTILCVGVVVFGASTGSRLLVFQAGHSALLALATVAAFALALRTPAKEPQGEPSGLSIRAAAAYSLPYLLANGLTQVASSAERWGLARLGSPSATAMFVQAVGLATAAVGALTSAFSTYYQPLISDAAATSAKPVHAALHLVLRYVALTALTLFGLCIVIALFGRQITALFFGQRFQSVAAILPWTVLGASLFSLGQAVQMISQAARDPLGANAARGISLAGYSAILLLLTSANSPELFFSKMYCLCNLAYVILTTVVSVILVRRETRNRAPATASVLGRAE